jgi:hypothetical protein
MPNWGQVIFGIIFGILFGIPHLIPILFWIDLSRGSFIWHPVDATDDRLK